MWRRENVTIGLSVKSVNESINNNAEREEEARGDRGSTASIPTRDDADVDHQPEAEGGLDGYGQSPQEAKKAFLEHLAELIAEEVMQSRSKDAPDGEEQGQK